MKKSIWAEQNNFFKIALKRVLILPKARSRKNAAIPAKKYGITKQKHIRGDKTLKKQKNGPNVNIYIYIFAQNIANACQGKPFKK